MAVAASTAPMVLHFFVARLKIDGQKKTSELYLRFKATDSAEDLTSNEPVLSSFCFPLGPETVPPKEYLASEDYTFTLTYGDGRRFQGFCRKFLPPAPKVGSKLRYPQVMCLIAEYPWCNFYFKVLQVLEQLLRSAPSGESLLESNHRDIPASSPTAAFLTELGRQLTPEPAAGQILKVPFPKSASLYGISPPRSLSAGGDAAWSEDSLELQVPPDCGNGKWNRGLSLARLLWHVPVGAMLTLISAMLLERRIILVGQSRDTVTAAVQAAAALLYPFKWHHIYLPLLPKTFKDYLTAPMPFMVGLPAALLPVLRNIPMDEVTLIDLDLGKCDPAPGSLRDDAQHLPWRGDLEAALTVAYANLKSPTEFESSPLIAGIMQEYLLKLVGNIRKFIHEDAPSHQSTSAERLQTVTSGAVLGSPSPRRTNPASAGHTGGTGGPGPGSNHSRRDDRDDTVKGYGQVFEHGAFVNSHRHNERARRFLSMFRHSQMYEVFVQEQLRSASEGYNPALEEDGGAFAEKAAKFLERRRARLAERMRALQLNPGAAGPGGAKWYNRHRRTESEEAALAAAGKGMRRVPTDPAQLSSIVDANGQLQVDPASFFEDDDDDLDDELSTSMESPASGGQSFTSMSTGDLRMGADGAGSRFGRSSSMSHETSPHQVHGVTDGNRTRSHGPVSTPGQHHELPGYGYSQQRGASDWGPPPSPGTSGDNGRGGATPKGLIISFQQGNKQYEGTFTSVVKDLWTDAKKAMQERREEKHLQQLHHMNQVNQLQTHSFPVSSPMTHQYPAQSGGSLSSGSAQYQKQLTGDGKPKQQSLASRYLPQNTGGSLLDGLGGRLRQPPAPQRPLVNLPEGSTLVPSSMPLASAAAEGCGAPYAASAQAIPAAAAPQEGAAPAASDDAWDPFGLSGTPAMQHA